MRRDPRESERERERASCSAYLVRQRLDLFIQDGRDCHFRLWVTSTGPGLRANRKPARGHRRRRRRRWRGLFAPLPSLYAPKPVEAHHLHEPSVARADTVLTHGCVLRTLPTPLHPLWTQQAQFIHARDVSERWHLQAPRHPADARHLLEFIFAHALPVHVHGCVLHTLLTHIRPLRTHRTQRISTNRITDILVWPHWRR